MSRRKRVTAGPQLKTRSQLEYMRQAGLVVSKVHQALREECRPGVTGQEMDNLVKDITYAAGAKPNFLNYQGFPASVCISVNEQIVHGIPSSRRFEAGDLVSFDCGAYVTEDGEQWHADAAFTMVVGGRQQALAGQKQRAQLNDITEQAMWAGVAALQGAKRVGEVGGAIEDYVEASSRHLAWTPGIIEGYSGHGIGRRLHEPPSVYNYRTRGRTDRVKPGMALCVEPMLVAGQIPTQVLSDDWTVVSADKEDAAHWEHTVAIVDGGISVLTSPDGGLSGLAPFGVVPIMIDKS